MAIGKREQDLLLEFWENKNNKRLITSIYRALAENTKLDDDEREEAEQIANQLMNFNKKTGFQKHEENPSIQRFIRKVFNYYAKDELSLEPTPGDKKQRESEVKEEYRDTVDFCLIELTSGKGQGINFWWNKDKQRNKERVEFDQGYISGDTHGKIPNDPGKILRRILKKNFTENQWTVEYWNKHFVEFIEALESGLRSTHKEWESRQSKRQEG
jgi:hypothetical protein